MKPSEVTSHRYVVFGAARSGIAAARMLHRHKLDVVVADEKTAEIPAELAEAGIPFHHGHLTSAILEGRTILVLSPGIPESNPSVVEARARGLRVISEIELASAFVPPAAKVIAITGTNGKTTTAAWTAHLLRAASKNALLGGNIGDAWSNSADLPENATAETAFVIETSSFQLEALEDFRPDIGVLTNLAPDHLDRYENYSDYVAAKRNMLRNMGEQQSFVLNADNPDSRGFTKGAPICAHWFSTDELPGEAGAFVRNGQIIIRDDNGKEHSLITAQELPLPGRHNLENALAASLAAHLAGATTDALIAGLKSFTGVEHRIEFCGEKNGIRFYNDSKATNVDSLEKALQSFSQPVVLIAGGKDKQSDYTALNDLIRNGVKALITLGEAAPLIESAWSGLVPTQRAANMQDAIERATAAAAPGDVVLLSPACASFDMYKNFEERGQDFKNRVRAHISSID